MIKKETEEITQGIFILLVKYNYISNEGKKKKEATTIETPVHNKLS